MSGGAGLPIHDVPRFSCSTPCKLGLEINRYRVGQLSSLQTIAPKYDLKGGHVPPPLVFRRVYIIPLVTHLPSQV